MKEFITYILLYIFVQPVLSQNYINDFGFEDVSQIKSSRKEYESFSLEKFNITDPFIWFVKDDKYKSVHAISNHDHYVINNHQKDENVYISNLRAHPAYEGYGYLSLKDNFSLYTKLKKPIKKRNKYRLEYFINKPFVANSANKYFYMSIVLSQKEPSIKENNKTQLIPNRIPHSEIKINKAVIYTFQKDKIDSIRIEPRPDLWQKFAVEFVAEDDFDYLGLVRDIKHPYGLTEFMHLDNVQLYLLEGTDEDESTQVLQTLAKQIQFETAKDILTPNAKLALDSLAIYLRNVDQDTFIELSGHTDSEGNAKENITLSKARVERVATYLQQKGVAKNKVLTHGFGATKPITTNETEAGRATNRRVEMQLINKKTASKIIFEPISFQEALDKAKKENKLVFVDAYTQWCKPCKQMDKEIFTDSAVAHIFNENFINLKMDMETEEGKPLNALYQIQGYPTLFFVDATGKLYFKRLGFMNIPEFAAYGKEVATLFKANQENSEKELEKRLFEVLKANYLSNPCDQDAVQNYITKLKDTTQIREVQQLYINCVAQKINFSKDEATFFIDILIKDKNDFAHQFYQQHREEFEKSYGDSLMAYENFMEEAFFFYNLERLKAQQVDSTLFIQYDKNIKSYRSFSDSLEAVSQRKGFNRPISKGFCNFLMYKTTIDFYTAVDQPQKVTDYILAFNQEEIFNTYIQYFGEDISVLKSLIVNHTEKLLIRQSKSQLESLYLTWVFLLENNYITSSKDYLLAAQVIYLKDEEQAKALLNKALALKDATFDEKLYERIKHLLD